MRFRNCAGLTLLVCACGGIVNAQEDHGGQAASAAAPQDVTGGGFPFPLGRYIDDEDCDTSEPTFGIVDFAADHSHEFEADGNVRFLKILRLGEGHYRITEEWPDFEAEGTYIVEAEYVATEEGRFQRRAMENGEAYAQDYKYCAPDTAIGRFGQY